MSAERETQSPAEPQTSADREPFDLVMARARARIAGKAGVSLPAGQRNEGDFGKLVERVCGRGLERMRRGEDVSPPPVQVANAAETRICWYIPERFRACVLDLCPAPVEGRCVCDGVRHFVIHTPSQRSAHKAATRWASKCGQGEGIALALVGAVGTGKSHLMYAAIRTANERGVNAGAWGWVELADDLRAASSATDHADRQAALQTKERLRAVRVIGLDEIRATSGTDFDGQAIGNLMTRAYRHCRDVIVTSNYVGEDLSNVIGLAASSRLTQINVTGPDYRQRILRAV